MISRASFFSSPFFLFFQASEHIKYFGEQGIYVVRNTKQKNDKILQGI